MAKWDKIQERGDVEDRRGSMQRAGVVGGISVTGIILVLAVGYFGGQEQAFNLLNQIAQTSQTQTTTTSQEYDGVDEYESFVSKVLGSNNTLWSNAFANSGESYQEPKLVLFRDGTQSACGGASSEVGPHYCNMDETIYLDERFFDELTQRFGARGGDVAEAYVIAHEVAHHVQGELGVIGEVDRLSRENPESQNELSVALELQADCYAGIWAGVMQGEWIIEPEEISQALDAAASVWDDRIQKATTGRVNPESWTHGSSADRKKWFTIGYTEESVAKCNTFGER